jgi:hypothetical protein
MARHGQADAEQGHDQANQTFGVTQGQAEYGPKRQGRGDGQRRVLWLPVPAWPEARPLRSQPPRP